jgi:hypothetical protein
VPGGGLYVPEPKSFKGTLGGNVSVGVGVQLQEGVGVGVGVLQEGQGVVVGLKDLADPNCADLED